MGISEFKMRCLGCHEIILFGCIRPRYQRSIFRRYRSLYDEGTLICDDCRKRGVEIKYKECGTAQEQFVRMLRNHDDRIHRIDVYWISQTGLTDLEHPRGTFLSSPNDASTSTADAIVGFPDELARTPHQLSSISQTRTNWKSPANNN